MVSNAKRFKYVYENEITSSEDDGTDSGPNETNQSLGKENPRTGRKPKCFSKNALMARENRLRKKMYLSKLENQVNYLRTENNKLSTIVDNQSFLIAEYKKEVKYLKSVISNSSDISLLIRNINQCTGMSVSSSLDKNLSLKNVCLPKPQLPIGRKTAHPWEESNSYPSFPTQEPNCLSSPDHTSVDYIAADFFKDIAMEFPLELTDNELLKPFPIDDQNAPAECVNLNEHDYTANRTEMSDEVGVCLHLSKHRVSLEFCSTCSENATQSWHS